MGGIGVSNRAYIGGYKNENGTDYRFKGKIANLRIWNNKQENKQIVTNMYKNLKGTEDNLIGEWFYEKTLINPKSFNGTKFIELSNLDINKQEGGYNTVEFWMFWDDTNTVMPFAWNTRYDLYFADGYFGFNTFNSDLLGIPSLPLKNRWVHVSAIFKNGDVTKDSCELYIYGTKQNIQNHLGSDKSRASAGDKVYIGGYKENNQTLYNFKGKLANFRIRNKKLDVLQIQSNIFKRLNGNESGLVGEWGLRDNPLNPKIFKGDMYSELSNVHINTGQGEKNTVEFWMFWDGTNAVMPFAWDSGYDLYLADGYFGFNTFNADVLGIPSDNLKNKWVHVAAVFYNGIPDKDNVKLYINGLPQSLQTLKGPFTRGGRASTNVYLGGYLEAGKKNYLFKGGITNLRIWKKELSEDQIKTYMYLNSAKAPDLVGQWKLENSEYLLKEK
ncbi:hypothetical protein PC41400_28180 [Paenibacillus chitinolyticus]|uniref:LamG domain-containing protein n=1 Tax=Paenibacillus chitinolyticus TaxID=79263 RepID=A0A410X3X5_9BACL|nr:LamG-like jellyroll fold domain-containing protein [Paenibacillus chitinolyticus]MCY9593325.1 LamG domain-containing protein [Paenibacillus chitinolyticus]MCY9599886.1 LamG domain-containing protein [Paenibacillus chitinolyticus]QAV21338.1 hypothetical protein PC41400_28180 [Paenibacillus chitinolyticus]